jgi:hypothetical protein
MTVALLIAVIVIVALEIRTDGLVARGLEFRSRANYLRRDERMLKENFDNTVQDWRETLAKARKEGDRAVLEWVEALGLSESELSKVERQSLARYSACVRLREYYERATWRPWRFPIPEKPVEQEAADIVNSRPNFD